MQFSVTCHADGCNAKVQSNVLQEHLLSNHGQVECRGCGFVLGILNARDHFDDEGECLKNKKVQSLIQLHSLGFFYNQGASCNSLFTINTQSWFASIVYDGVLGPMCLVGSHN